MPLARSLRPEQWLEIDSAAFERSNFTLEGIKVFAVPEATLLINGQQVVGGIGDDLIALLRQSPRGFELIRYGHADLIEYVEDLLLVDERPRRKRQPRAGAKNLLELIEQIQDVHGIQDTPARTASGSHLFCA